MKINSLLKKLHLPIQINNHIVFGITSNSKEVKENYIFVAIKGYKNNGNDFITDAINNGAKTIISEEYFDFSNFILVNDSKEILALLLYHYNYNKFKKITFIGVTGTNGKTSTSTLIYDFLKYNNKKCILIGSNGIISLNKNEITANTTPNIEKIYDNINYAYINGYKYVVIEVSSVAVIEKRIKYIPFKIMIFTNFSLDHLDYHKTLDNYFNAKLEIFKILDSGSYAVVNSDDIKSKDIINATKAKVLTYGINVGNIKISNIINDSYLSFIFNNKIYKTNLIGKFNIYNILPLFIVSNILKLKKNIFLFLLLEKPIPGRMNLIIHKNKRFIIDYAHTPKALENVLNEVKNIKHNKVFVIVGCGGSRDKSKREVIGKILNKYDYNIILTSDNPRYEDECLIIKDIEKGLIKEHIVYVSRKEAIDYAYNHSNCDDLILVLGKGIERYIEKKGIKEEYCDYDYIYSLD